MNEIVVFLVNVDKQDDLADAAGINSMFKPNFTNTLV
jgi:hypothetical protein